MLDFPSSIAIAGAWGYIGRKFLDAARALGLKIHVFDPGPVPSDLNTAGLARYVDEQQFYRLRADLFHLAVHPEHRRVGMEILLSSPPGEPQLILVEKPMAPPENPEECLRILDAVGRSGAVLLYDFPELYDPITETICDYLSSLNDMRILSIYVQRSKDRENPENPRNYKRMVHIQYQESVHCLAFVLYILGRARGALDAVFDGGLLAQAESQPYAPPNPQDYPYVVDGQCRFSLRLGTVQVRGLTDFKRGAEGMKLRVVEGLAGKTPFRIEADYQEGRKRLLINDNRMPVPPAADSYASVIRTLGRWHRSVSRAALMGGLYPNPDFARLTYQLSSVLWRSCWEGKSVSLDSLEALKAFDARFADAVPRMPRYGRVGAP